ncbi:MAG: hypothetical protein ABW182_08380 [Sphingomonas sp.]
MKRIPVIAAMIAAAALVASPPAAASPQVTLTGRTLATPKLAGDLMRTIAGYWRRSAGCATISSAHMQVMSRSYAPRQPTRPATALGGHFEIWTINACAAAQRFQVAMWPSPRGGAEFAITPLGGRVPLRR